MKYKNVQLFICGLLFSSVVLAQVKLENIDNIKEPAALLAEQKLTDVGKIKNIMVPSFCINFVSKSCLPVAKVKTPPLPTAQNNVMIITGIRDHVYQQITDEAYQYYIFKLVEKGFLITDRDKFEQNYSYKTMVHNEPNNTEFKIQGNLNEPFYKLSGATHARTFSAGNNIWFQFMNVPANLPKVNKMAKELQSTLAEMNLTVDFLEYIAQKGKIEPCSVANTMGVLIPFNFDFKPKLNILSFSANFVTPSYLYGNSSQKINLSSEKKFFKDIKFFPKNPDLELNFGKSAKFFELVVDEQVYKATAIELLKKYIDGTVDRLMGVVPVEIVVPTKPGVKSKTNASPVKK